MAKPGKARDASAADPMRGPGSDLVRQLAQIVGSDHTRTNAGDLAAFSRDATPLFAHAPDVVVFPGSTGEVAAILRLASQLGVPVVPRGAGSNLCAATVPTRGGIVLVLTRMNRVLEVSREEMLARVQPGVTTLQLSDAAARSGLLFAPDPGSKAVSTVGGNIATCAGGLRGLKYGVTRNYVLGLELVLPTGEVILTGGRLWKDVAGYDLTRLVTGSEGTLGVITEATMALLPNPAAMSTGVAYFADLAAAGKAVTDIISSGIVPATLEFLDATCIGAVEDFAALGLRRDAGALLLFGDDGEADIVARRLSEMADICRQRNALEVTVASAVAEAEALLAARRCSLPALARKGPLTILEDVAVPRPAVPKMVEEIAAIAERHALTIGTFGHAGDGNLHPTCVLSPHDEAAIRAAHRAFDEIFAAAIRLDGTPSGEHGIGAAKLPYLSRKLGSDQMALLRRIKAAFDPAGILNPGKLGS
jgi:glycolate oxidase